MAFKFIENRHPEQDPNTDLNFDNDILYRELTNDGRLNGYNLPSIAKNSITLQKKTNKQENKQENIRENMSDTKRSSYTIYIYFILTVILLILIWYFYGPTQKIKKKNIIDTYPNHPELTMMSPDMGMDARFGEL